MDKKGRDRKGNGFHLLASRGNRNEEGRRGGGEPLDRTLGKGIGMGAATAIS